MTNEEALKYLQKEKCYTEPMCVDGFCKDKEGRRCPIQVAIEALEKQIAKKPITLSFEFFGPNDYPACPNCEEEVIEGESKFCCNCGQCIDWEDYDDD